MTPAKKPATKAAPKAAPKFTSRTAAATAPPPPASTFTDDEIQAMAQAFHDIAVGVSQVRLNAITAGAKLTDPNIVQLQGDTFSLINASSNLALQAAKLTLANAAAAAAQITTATKAANQALDKLKDVDKAVKIASAVIVLGLAITTRDIGQIGSATQGVLAAAGVKLPT
jgi:hypothetical protein